MPNASSWNNGSPNTNTGSGYGLAIDNAFQNVIFGNSAFSTIDLDHNGTLIASNINVRNKKCKELIHTGIGQWLIAQSKHQWLKNTPHRFTIAQRGNSNIFAII